MDDVVIRLGNITKYYKLYDNTKDRLKEALHPFNKKYHKPFYAIKNLNLEIKKGDVLGLVGRNGCGKSTLLKLITGVLQPNEGTISVEGKITALLELGAGFNPEFTGIDNIQFYAKVLGITDQALEEKLPLIIDFAELGDFLYQPVKTYSSGMKSRLGFAVAVHVNPEILILDEVLAVGDALFKRKCYAKMEEFFNAGKTILFVSHDTNSVNKLCNRAILLNEGEIILDSVPSEVTKYYEKLIFSKPTNTRAVLQEISDKNKHLIHRSTSDEHSKTTDFKNEPAARLKPYFLSELKPKTTVKYNSSRAEIRDPHFTTLTGERVNVLVCGDEYIYRYTVSSMATMHNVCLGMQIKDIHGVTITASSSHYANSLIPQMRPGGSVAVEWRFKCSLISGFFYTNAGISEVIADTPEYVARWVDAAMFKVVSKDKRITKGVVDMEQSLDWKITY